jgi:hypothetical protein
MSRLGIFNRIRGCSPIYGASMAMHDLYWLLRRTRQGSYSQHGEDTFVANFFAGRKKGFYLDIGASHPFKLSNTYLLYRSGWSGATVEPIPRLGKLHRIWRRRDSLFPIGVGFKHDVLEFFEMTPSVLSTLDRSVADQYVAEGKAALYKKYEIEVLPINEIIDRVSALGQVDFMSIDVEGLDADMLAEIDYSRFRPALICSEANSSEAQRKTEVIFERAGYKIVKAIGCNLMAIPA